MDDNRIPRHSYLPGVCLPLYPEDWLTKQTNKSAEQDAAKNEPVSIPLLPVVSVFLFPGAQLPMRIRQSTWAEYIANAIRDSRKRNASQQVRIGIVTLVRSRGITLDEGGLVGKIGSFATITYTHEPVTPTVIHSNNDVPEGSDPRRVRGRLEAEEIVITVIGTGRFRVVSRMENSANRALPLYNVLEIEDKDSFTLPQEIQYRPFVNKQVQLMSSISSVPFVAFKVLWPRTLVDNIVSELLENKAYDGFRNLPSSSGYIVDKNDVHNKQRVTNGNPTAFSFWLADKLPMSEEDRMGLLEKTCTVERLLFIRKLVRSQDKVQYLRCAYCNAKVGRVPDIFTVDGADGANGAYVNPHGVIHQTWTVRQVCDNSVFTVGDAEIQDSWFPGYSWTIAHCANCFSHIGWKFARVSPLQEELDISIEECRPTSFWGISGANIRMFSL